MEAHVSKMRLKSSDNGPLVVAQHNGNENSLNSLTRHYNNQQDFSNTTGLTPENEVFNNGTRDSVRRRQDTLQWCNTINTIKHQQIESNNKSISTEDTSNYVHQQQTGRNQQLRPLYNINNNNLAANLRTTPASNHQPRGTTASSVCSESSPDDSLLDYEEAQQSCSSVDTSPQDEDRGFDLSDSELSDDGNLSGGDNHLQSRGIVNPNYPGFQHLAHTLDYTIKACSDTDFTDDDLDIEQDTTKVNTCDVNNINNNNNNEEDIEYKIDSVNRLDSVENIQKVFYDKPKLNIPLEFDTEKQTNCLDSASGSNLGSDEDLEGNILTEPEGIPLKLNITESVSTADIVGDFGKDLERELGRIVGRGIEQELEEAVEKLSVANDLSPSALKYNIEPNADEPFEKITPTAVVEKSDPVQIETVEPLESVVVKQEFPVASQPITVKLENDDSEVFNPIPIQKMADIKVARVTSTEALTLKMNQTITQISVPLKENLKTKIEDAILSEARECITDPVEKQMMEKEEKEKMEPMKKQRRDSNRETEELREHAMEVEELEKFCKEDKTKDDMEKDEDSAVPRKKEKMDFNYVKKRRDSSQQIASLITIPRRELGGRIRDNLNRRSLPAAREKKRTSPEILGSFDVYNIETAMPKIDLDAIESHLKAAREEERRRRTDREEIRRRLAMGSEDDYYNGCDRPGRKPSLQARLQSGMNLQICFMNETASDTESPSSDTECSITEVKHTSLPAKPAYNMQPLTHPKSTIQPRPVSLPLGITQPLLQPVTQPMTEADFFARQARLQTEARMALAQAKEMAHMQMEVERQRQKKSPITEMVRSSLEKVGIPFPEERRRVSRQILTEMNVAQLQVIVNDLHTQIETLNEKLVRFLMNRDDLHMEQDSMLVDIEDLTRYLGAKEQTVKDQKFSSHNNNIPPPSPAPASPLTAINNTVKPRLHRIASLVKK